MSLPRKYRYRDLIALGEGQTKRGIQSRVDRGLFPPPDLHDPVDGSAIWFETTIAAHRERERQAVEHFTAAILPQRGLAARQAKAAARALGTSSDETGG